MSTNKDAGELLAVIDKKYEWDGRGLSSKEIKEITKWENHRILVATNYLKDIGAITILRSWGNDNGLANFDIEGLTGLGIEMVQDSNKFKRTFGIEIGVPGVFKLFWSASQK